jgi:hypothetical protein
MEHKIDFIQKEWDAAQNSKGQIKFNTNGVDNTVLIIRTGRKFFYRLWFLISAPIMWLIKGEIKIR